MRFCVVVTQIPVLKYFAHVPSQQIYRLGMRSSGVGLITLIV